jgi:hypothetical protein
METIPRIIYCFWFGPEMSADRKQCFETIKINSKVSVSLITNDNLKEYELKEYPFHPGFELLSATHKSDYLRSYFMYFYGGGYTDIKRCHYDWNPYFDLLEQSDKTFIGCKQYKPNHIAYKPYKDFYDQLVGVNCFIFKPKSIVGKLWHIETNSLLDEKLPYLKQHPGTYHHRAIYGGVQGEPSAFLESKYPIEWNELLGRIFHKLQYENLGSFLYDLPFPDINNYR